MIKYTCFEVPIVGEVATFYEFKESPWYGIKFYFTNIKPENPDDMKNLKGSVKLKFSYVVLDDQGRGDLENNEELDRQVGVVLQDLMTIDED